MGYAEAIDQQMEMYSFYASREGWGMVERMMGQPWASGSKEANASDVAERVLLAIGAGNPFAVAPTVCSTLAYGSTTFPLPYSLSPDRVPVLNGFVWFEQALALPEWQEGPPKPLRALAWAPARVSLDMLPGKSRIASIDDPSHLILVAFHDVSWCRVPVIAHLMTMGLGVPIADDETALRADGRPRREATLRYLFAFFEFVAQRLFTVSKRPILNNTARRRLTKALGHEPSVRVVELRRREYQQHDESQGSGVEYSCQWLVRGHWHQYHTKEGLQPRWVAPYVKGPTDKPLRVAAQTAYAVVR